MCIPVYAIHRDERYFPDPLTYNPERFNETNRNSIPHYAYMPFGLGPRNCLGERMGIIQTKVGLINVLGENSVEVCEETMLDIKIHKTALLVVPEKPIMLRIRKDNDTQ